MADKSPEGFVGASPQAMEEYRDIQWDRLKRLIGLRRDFADDLDERGLKMIDLSLKAAFEDCSEVGMGDKARNIIRKTIPDFIKKLDEEPNT